MEFNVYALGSNEGKLLESFGNPSKFISKLLKPFGTQWIAHSTESQLKFNRKPLNFVGNPLEGFQTSLAIAWNPLQLHTNPATFTGSPMKFSKIHSEFNRTYMKFDGIPVKFHAIPVKSLKHIWILSQSISKSLSIQGKISEFLWNTIKILLETLWHSMEILRNPWEFRGTRSEI